MHTKEPWKINNNCKDEIGTTSNFDNQSFNMIIPHASAFGENATDDAQRIMLCVNACRYIGNEILEQVISGVRIITTDIT